MGYTSGGKASKGPNLGLLPSSRWEGEFATLYQIKKYVKVIELAIYKAITLIYPKMQVIFLKKASYNNYYLLLLFKGQPHDKD